MSKPVVEDYDRQVFINCPFDDDYLPMLRAIVFSIHACGCKARCALEVVDAGEVRMSKILRLIRGCRFGLHDISRTSLDEMNGLPRFNMPLELGLFLGAAHFGSGGQRRKRTLIMDISGIVIRNSSPTSPDKTSSHIEMMRRLSLASCGTG